MWIGPSGETFSTQIPSAQMYSYSASAPSCATLPPDTLPPLYVFFLLVWVCACVRVCMGVCVCVCMNVFLHYWSFVIFYTHRTTAAPPTLTQGPTVPGSTPQVTTDQTTTSPPVTDVNGVTLPVTPVPTGTNADGTPIDTAPGTTPSGTNADGLPITGIPVPTTPDATPAGQRSSRKSGPLRWV